MKELWKALSGYEGYYEVSNKGNVRSVDREVVGSDNKRYFYRGRLLKQHPDRVGYMRVALTKDKRTSWRSVHRLVAQAFVPNPSNLPEINHKDENKSNNSADNLEWCDRNYNVRYGLYAEKMSSAMTNNKYNSKPVIATLPDGTEEYYPSMAEAGFRFTGRRNAGSISYALKGVQATAYGRKWRYA